VRRASRVKGIRCTTGVTPDMLGVLYLARVRFAPSTSVVSSMTSDVPPDMYGVFVGTHVPSADLSVNRIGMTLDTIGAQVIHIYSMCHWNCAS
jgi:hypothetical protein